MSLKAELETWASALQAYDEENFEAALELFSRIADSSKILCNMGLIYATMGEHEAAVERFMDATKLDQYLAVAYFQCGVSNFLLGRYDLAYKDFDEALLYLRGNQAINYEQIGLAFRLYSAEVLFNKALSLIYVGQIQQGLADMEEARKEKATEEHNVIDDAISDRGEGYTVFSIPVGILYRPSAKKLKNAVTKDYLGKAILVAASDPMDNSTEFSGAARLKQGISPAGIYLDRPDLPKKNESPPGLLIQPSATFSPRNGDGNNSAGLERSKTTPFRGIVDAQSPSEYTGLSRSRTQITPARSGTTLTDPGGRQVRSPQKRLSGMGGFDGAPNNDSISITDFYDGYASRESSPIESRTTTDRGWPRNNAPVSLSRATSRNAKSAPLGGSMKRQVTRKTTTRRTRSPQNEAGYGSENDDLTLIRVKIYHQNEVRGMTMTADIEFPEFLDKINAKFQRQVGDLDLKFADEDGAKISIQDESDFEMAIETARTLAKGKPEGKLELWCRDL